MADVKMTVDILYQTHLKVNGIECLSKNKFPDISDHLRV